MKKVSTTGNPVFSNSSLPNPVLVTRQIEDLREVLRRMRAYRSATFDAVISKKLEQLKERN
ncbi:MAG TPA: hypothetical protein VF177_11710 [Anaerolineae bacterium]